MICSSLIVVMMNVERTVLSAGNLADQVRRMLTMRDECVEVRSFTSYDDAALIRKFAEAIQTVMPAHATHAHAAESQILEASLDGRCVHRGASRESLAQNVINHRHVVAHDVDAKRTVAAIDALYDVIECIVGDDREDGPKDLLLHHPQVLRRIDGERDRHLPTLPIYLAIRLERHNAHVPRFRLS
jgi:hypothetical protein